MRLRSYFTNFLSSIFKFGLHKKHPKTKPSRNVAFIELSNICNAQCVFCSYPAIAESGKTMQHMSEQTYRASLNKALDLGYARLGFTPTTGELFANKHWKEYLATALVEDRVLSLYFYSNAILLGQKNIDAILSLPNIEKIEKFYFSVGGLDTETYKHMFGVDKFEIVTRNINKLCDILKSSGSKLRIDCEVRLPKNAHSSKRQVHEVFNKAGYPYFESGVQKKFDPLGGMITDANLLYLPPIESKISPCYRLNDIRFDANGKIWMCGCVVSEQPTDKSLLIGSIADNNVTLNQKKQAIFNQWRSGQLPTVCAHCRVYKPSNSDN